VLYIGVMPRLRTRLVLLIVIGMALVARAGDAAPELALRDLVGAEHKLAEYRGKPVVLNFWATWCVPCAAEMPLLNEMQKRYKSRVLFLAASIDDDDMKPEVEAFIKKHQAEALTVMMGATIDSLREFGLKQVMPGTVFIDAEGNIVDRVSGKLQRADFTARLKKLVGEPAVSPGKPLVQNSGPSDDDWDWVNKNYGGILNEFVPMKAEGGLYLSYRSHRDLYTDVLEYGFLLGYELRENKPGLQEFLTAHVRLADGVSIYDQLMKMHRDKPNESAETIRHKVTVKKWSLSEKTCPAIQEQFRKFQNLSIRVPEFDSIVLHPMVHQFHVEAGLGTMDLELDDSEHSLVLWALETRKALDSCINSSALKH
jgi:thiol-disulfide isomerase/thioredoxin